MANEKQRQGEPDQWFLRIGEGVFGPVSRNGLLLWAEQGRVLPDHEISTDRKKWTPARAADFLEMRWFIDDGKGDPRGPLNRKAAEALLAGGKAPEGSRIVSAEEIDAAALAENPPDLPGGDAAARKAKSEAEAALQKAKSEAETALQKAKSDAETALQKAKAEGEAALQKAKSEAEAALREAKAEAAAAAEALERRLAAREETIALLKQDLAAAEEERDALRPRCETLQRAWEETRGELQAANTARQAAETAAREKDSAFTELLTASNERDERYQARIAALEKVASQSPEEVDRFLAARAALYEWMSNGEAALEQTIEEERARIEETRRAGQKRLDDLTGRRRALLRYLGEGPEEMARRILREQPADPQRARLRAELENLRVTSRRDREVIAGREQELLRKLQALENENAHLVEVSDENERLQSRLADARELLARREGELAEMLKKQDEESKAFEEARQSLLARIEELEQAAGHAAGEGPHEKPPRLASWLRLQR